MQRTECPTRRAVSGRPLIRRLTGHSVLDIGRGRTIVDAWKSLSGREPTAQRAMAEKLDDLSKGSLHTGRMKGFLFGDPRRFLTNLAMQLRLSAAFTEFRAASENDRDIKPSFRKFAAAAEVWQRQHGYEGAWWWPHLRETLRKVHSPSINAVLDAKGEGKTPFDRVQDSFRKTETLTTQLLAAMSRTAAAH